MMIKVALIGYGVSGRYFHGMLLKEIHGFEVKTVVARSVDKVEQAKVDFPNASVVQEFSLVLNDSDIDLVVICSPNEVHAEQAEAAMRAGKHVVMEKPFTVTSKEAEKLNKLSEELGLVLSVYHNRRYDSDFKTVKKVLASGVLGKLVEFESHFDRFRNVIRKEAWREAARPGTGIVYDLGSHLIDQALSLFGMPFEVYADLDMQRGGETHDQFEIILYYEKLKVSLKAGMLVKEPLPRFILQGTEGAFVKYGLDTQEASLREGVRPVGDEWGEEPESLWGILNTSDGRAAYPSEKGDYKAYYENIKAAITFKQPLEISAVDGFNVIQIIEAAIQSNEEKRRISINQCF